MHEGIACLMVKNISLDSSSRTALYQLAIQMMKESKEKMTFRGDYGEGVLTLLQRSMYFLSQSGPAFVAEIETDQGKGKVRFVVPERYLRLELDFEQYEWVTEKTEQNPPPGFSGGWAN